MSSRKAVPMDFFAVPIAEFEYRQTAIDEPEATAVVEEEEPAQPEVRLPEATYHSQLAAARAQAIAETEARLKQSYEQQLQVEYGKISKALLQFEQTRKDYFSRVEGEVVRLSLAIAKKVLHREAQVDPMLVTAIVQIALSQLKDGSSATIRVRPQDAQRWQNHFDSLALDLSISVVGDAELSAADCILETELGSVNFSLDAQLKEVEQGFFDVLAQKPQS